MNPTFHFAWIGETALSDGGAALRREIAEADRCRPYAALLHSGNLLRGNNPRRISMALLQDELAAFRGSVSSGVLLPALGRHDGYRSERYAGQLCCDMMTEALWAEQTVYLEAFPWLRRAPNKPYYYMDFHDARVRVVVLCSYFFQMDEQAELFARYTGIDIPQLRWLREEALPSPPDYTLLLLSHVMPNTRFETGHDPFIYNRRSTEPLLAVLQEPLRRGNPVVWLAGGYGDAAVSSAVAPGVSLDSTDSGGVLLLPHRMTCGDTPRLTDGCLDAAGHTLTLRTDGCETLYRF